MTLTKLTITTGEIPFSWPTLPRPGTTWYRHILPPSTTSPSPSPPLPPLVVLHGGPGATHDYLTPTFDLLAARTGRAVVYYDQIGNGRSSHYPETRLSGTTVWSVELFVAELHNLLTHLGMKDKGFDLYGQSWGAMLAASYAVWCSSSDNDTPSSATLAPRKVIIGSGTASMSLWADYSRILINTLPPAVAKTLLDCEARHDYTSPSWESAVAVFYKTYLCRIDPLPPALSETMRWLKVDDTVYMTMNGPSEFTVVGTMRDWTIVEDLHKIKAPTLVINGEFDEAGDSCIAPFFWNIPRAKWVTMGGCSHSAHLEQPMRYVELVDQFLKG